MTPAAQYLADARYTRKVGDAVVVISTIYPEQNTPRNEAFKAGVWHCLASQPVFHGPETKWETTLKAAQC
jgi:D-sedoheptulose 7-phosphate isomerase